MPGDAENRPLARVRALLLDPRAHLAALVALAALVIFARAGAGALANYDDAYYAEKAKQMLRTGDWLTPRFNGVERLDNPPLFLWLIAASFAVMGLTSFAAVFWSALAGVAAVGLTVALARRMGREPFEAWAAGLVLLGTGYFLKYANHAMFDVFLAALFLAALLAYRRAWDGSARAWALLGLLTGLGVLTKSVLGVFPLALVALHTLWSGRVRASLAHGAWLAPLVAAAAVAPWYGYQLAHHRAAFLAEHVSWLLMERGLGTGTGAASPSRPLGYVRELSFTYWPWLPFAVSGWLMSLRGAFRAPAGRDGEWSARERARLLVLWPLVVVGVLSLGHEKKLWYVMSVFPALALLSAHALAAWIRGQRVRERVTLGGFAFAAAAGLVLALTPFGAAPARRPDLQVVARASRSLVPVSGRVVTLERDYWSIAHQFVFYSDRTLVPGDGTAATLRAALDSGDWALLSRNEFARAVAADSLRYPRVLSSGKWTLVHAAPAPDVTLDPPNASE